MLIVQKYGGSSVANAERVFNCARRISESYKAGNSVVVVLSAQGRTTNELIAKASEITDEPSKREMDMLLTTGEQQSVALMALALHKLGFPAISLNAGQAGIMTTSTHQNARFKRIETDRILSELDKKNIVVVTGFQGVDKYGDPTTLGRGASDTSAVALAASLNADICEIYTDVDGVYTADPRVVKNAVKLDEISYDEMLELASLGAKVLQNRSVELAKKYNVKLVVRSSMTDAEGTQVMAREFIKKGETNVENMFVNGVAIDKDVSRISAVGLKDEPGTAFKIFSLLAKNKISVDIILQSIGRNNSKDISFTIAKVNLNDALRVLNENLGSIGCEHISHDDKVAKLSVVGAGMATNPGVASMMFEALYNEGININMISTSEIKISCLIDEADAERGMNAVHDKFIRQASK